MSSPVPEQPVSIGKSPGDQLRALPARYYTEDEVLAREKEQIFFRSWQFACHVGELEKPGAYVTTEILGQNVFIVRDKQGELRAFYNVCPHRGHKLVEGAGRKNVIVCPYHQWSYSLDGNLLNSRKTPTSEMPERTAV